MKPQDNSLPKDDSPQPKTVRTVRFIATAMNPADMKINSSQVSHNLSATLRDRKTASSSAMSELVLRNESDALDLKKMYGDTNRRNFQFVKSKFESDVVKGVLSKQELEKHEKGLGNLGYLVNQYEIFLALKSLDQSLYVSIESLTDLVNRGVITSAIPLVEAYCDRIKNLIEEGADINLVSGNGFCPIHVAAFSENLDLLQFLIDRGASLDALAADDQTALHIATVSRDVAIVSSLITAMRSDPEKFRERINKQNSYGDTALHNVSLKGRMRNGMDIARMLISEGAAFNIKNRDGKTAASFALESSFTELIQLMRQKANGEKLSAEVASTQVQPQLPPVVPEVVKPTPEEYKKILEERLSQLQRLAVLSSRASKISDVEEAVSLIGLSNSEIDVTTNEGWTLAHIAAKLGCEGVVDNLITRKAQINKRTTRDNLSVLDCAFASNNHNIIKKLITHSEIDALAVSEVLRNAISSNNKTVVSLIFNEILRKYPNDILPEESLMAKFANLEKSDRDELIRGWRVGSNLGSVKVNSKNFKEKINEFEKAVNKIIEKRSATAEVIEEAPVKTLTKKQRQEVKDAKKAEAKIIEDERRAADAKRRVEYELRKKESAQNMSLKEDDEGKIDEELPKIIEEYQLMEEDSSLGILVQTTVKESFVKHKDGSEFLDIGAIELTEISAEIPMEITQEFQVKGSLEDDVEAEEIRNSQLQEMEDFLKGKREIFHVACLPRFLHKSVSDLLENGHGVSLKGSATYSQKEINRIPGDLDIDVVIDDFSQKTNEEIKSFVKEKFGVEISNKEIFRGKFKDNSEFTVNIKDEGRKLDISLYDGKKMPSAHLSWTNSKERNIHFLRDGSASIDRRPRGLKDYHYDLSQNFVMNTQAHGLVFRLCLLEASGQITARDRSRCIMVPQPVDLTEVLQRELFLYKKPDVTSSFPEKINHFMQEAHGLDAKHQKDFLGAMSRISCANLDPQYQTLRDMIGQMCSPSVAMKPDNARKMLGNKEHKSSVKSSFSYQQTQRFSEGQNSANL